MEWWFNSAGLCCMGHCSMRCEERERNTIERRIHEAHLPRVKTLDEFDYTQSPNVTAPKMRDLAEGGYIERADRFCSSANVALAKRIC